MTQLQPTSITVATSTRPHTIIMARTSTKGAKTHLQFPLGESVGDTHYSKSSSPARITMKAMNQAWPTLEANYGSRWFYKTATQETTKTSLCKWPTISCNRYSINPLLHEPVSEGSNSNPYFTMIDHQIQREASLSTKVGAKVAHLWEISKRK